eukprot:m.52938 g.52938  ORF g.52938 m.52938 type:complete len:440 (+) comp34238_c0_seq3:31-1350(+)
MAARRVQAYLEKHKVSQLFEDLMAKVIHDMPSSPISYVIRVLQKKETRALAQKTFPGPISTKLTTPASKLAIPGNVRPTRPKSTTTSSTSIRGAAKEPLDVLPAPMTSMKTDVIEYSLDGEQVGIRKTEEEKNVRKSVINLKRKKQLQADRKKNLSQLVLKTSGKPSSGSHNGRENFQLTDEEGMESWNQSIKPSLNISNVQEGICAHCARLLSSEQADRVSLVSNLASTVTLADNERDDFYFATAQSDDDFESASQVGPGSNTTPVWFGERSKKGRHDVIASEEGRESLQLFDSSNQSQPDFLRIENRRLSVTSGSGRVTPRSNKWDQRESFSGSQVSLQAAGRPLASSRSLLEMLHAESSENEPQMKSISLKGWWNCSPSVFLVFHLLAGSTVQNLLDDELSSSQRGSRAVKSTDMAFSDDESDDGRHPTSRLGSEL